MTFTYVSSKIDTLCCTIMPRCIKSAQRFGNDFLAERLFIFKDFCVFLLLITSHFIRFFYEVVTVDPESLAFHEYFFKYFFIVYVKSICIIFHVLDN